MNNNYYRGAFGALFLIGAFLVWRNRDMIREKVESSGIMESDWFSGLKSRISSEIEDRVA